MFSYFPIFGLCIATAAQQVFISAAGRSERPKCSSSPCQSIPSHHFSNFSYTQTETIRYATAAVPSPQPTYGLPYASLTHLFADVSTTSWDNWYPNATSTAIDGTDPYGQSAWSSLWHAANLPSFTRGIYSSTVTPTQIPTSDLVLPPPLYFAPADCYNFPSDFKFGVAGSAPQIEGAIADEGKGPAAPDFRLRLAATSPEVFKEVEVTEIESNYVAAEHYYLYKQDIVRLAAMGIRYYSFSIAWSRILPFGTTDSPVNSRGLEHYEDLIDFAISKGLQPIVTLIHGDPPAVFLGTDVIEGLNERAYLGSGPMGNCGYQNKTFEDAFVNYGKIIMSHFADRVPIWITFNEPLSGVISGPSVDHIIKAHARLWHFYRDEIKGTGLLSMKMSGFPAMPLDPRNQSHIAVAQHWDNLNIGTLLDPLALCIDYPDAYKSTVQDYIPLTGLDLQYLCGTIDFIAADIYTTLSVFPVLSNITECSSNNASSNTLYPQCMGASTTTPQKWNIGYHPDYLIYSTPTYLRTQLNYLWNVYKRPIMITEFGLPISTLSNPISANTLQDIQFDRDRSDYYLSYLSEVLKAIWEDGVDVMGALMWSWVDNWEWGSFTHAFGLQYNNRTTCERTYKRSFFDVVDFVETRRYA